MYNPEDYANDTRYQDEETMLSDDKPKGISIATIKTNAAIEPDAPFIPPVRTEETEKLAEEIYKYYNTHPGLDYYWLIGIIDDFERKTKGLPTHQQMREEYDKKYGITETVTWTNTIDDKEYNDALLEELNRPVTFWNYTLPHMWRRHVMQKIWWMQSHWEEYKKNRKCLTVKESRQVLALIRRAEISYSAHVVVFNNTMKYLAKKKLAKSHVYADLNQMRATTENIDLKELARVKKELFD